MANSAPRRARAARRKNSLPAPPRAHLDRAGPGSPPAGSRSIHGAAKLRERLNTVRPSAAGEGGSARPPCPARSHEPSHAGRRRDLDGGSARTGKRASARRRSAGEKSSLTCGPRLARALLGGKLEDLPDSRRAAPAQGVVQSIWSISRRPVLAEVTAGLQLSQREGGVEEPASTISVGWSKRIPGRAQLADSRTNMNPPAIRETPPRSKARPLERLFVPASARPRASGRAPTRTRLLGPPHAHCRMAASTAARNPRSPWPRGDGGNLPLKRTNHPSAAASSASPSSAPCLGCSPARQKALRL